MMKKKRRRKTLTMMMIRSIVHYSIFIQFYTDDPLQMTALQYCDRISNTISNIISFYLIVQNVMFLSTFKKAIKDRHKERNQYDRDFDL
jgi:hypothetical protein